MNSVIRPAIVAQKDFIEYELIFSQRKTLSVQITREGNIVVRAPKRMAKRLIVKFLKENEDWIRTRQQEIKEASYSQISKGLTEKERAYYIEQAKVVISKKAAYYAQIMGVTYNRITIRDQKTRWGSCSAKGNLNFNWKLMLAPEKVLDYVVIHELAHRREMNHSSRFYAVLAEVMPEYKEWQKWLRLNGKQL